MNDYREYSDYLMHYGRKGMQWGKHLPGIVEWWKNNVTGSNYQKAIEGSQRERYNAIKDVQSGSDRGYYQNRGRYLQGYDNNGKPIYGGHVGDYKDWHDHSNTGSVRMNTNVSAKADIVNMNKDIAYNKERYNQSFKGKVESLLNKAATTINNIDTKIKQKGKNICGSILKKFGF